MDEQDEDFAYGLTEIEWSKANRKNLRTGFIFLGCVLLFIIGITVWFFA